MYIILGIFEVNKFIIIYIYHIILFYVYIFIIYIIYFINISTFVCILEVEISRYSKCILKYF